MDEDFQQPLFCYHQRRTYQETDKSICVVCLDCRLAGPHVAIGISKYLAKLEAQHQYFLEANRVDDNFQKVQNRER